MPDDVQKLLEMGRALSERAAELKKVFNALDAEIAEVDAQIERLKQQEIESTS